MSQATLNLPVTGVLSGLALVNYVNDALARLASLSSGNTDPSTLAGGVQPYSLWIDTSATPPALKIRNNTNTAWANIGTINGSNFVPDLSNVDVANALGFTPLTEAQVDQKISAASTNIDAAVLAEANARATAVQNEATARANADNGKADKGGGNASGTWPISITGNCNYANRAGSAPADGGNANYANSSGYAGSAGNGVSGFSTYSANQPNGGYKFMARITCQNGSYFDTLISDYSW